MGHGLFAPLIAGYIIWQNRTELLRTQLNPAWAGLLLVVAGFLSMIVGVRGADFFIARMGFWIALVGIGGVVVGTLATIGGNALLNWLQGRKQKRFNRG